MKGHKITLTKHHKKSVTPDYMTDLGLATMLSLPCLVTQGSQLMTIQFSDITSSQVDITYFIAS